MTGEQASVIVDFMGVFQQPAVGFVTMAMNHSIHHRGQLSSYLRPMGAKVQAIYGMSADDNPFAKSRLPGAMGQVLRASCSTAPGPHPPSPRVEVFPPAPSQSGCAPSPPR
ncbi:MAG: hypothetical protein FJW31_04785 [Acidobacteria bacterium]|nr:hypothetical protein [Acidobacteriota bacterium]